MKLDQVTDGELSILQVLWDRGHATTREITEQLHEDANDPKMASVQKLIERLEAKGCVVRDRSNRAHLFRASVKKDEFVNSRLQALANRLCAGSLGSLATTLLGSGRLSRKERARLYEMIAERWPDDRNPLGK